MCFKRSHSLGNGPSPALASTSTTCFGKSTGTHLQVHSSQPKTLMTQVVNIFERAAIARTRLLPRLQGAPAAPEEHYDAPFQGYLALAAPPDLLTGNLLGRSSRVTQVAALAPPSPVAVASVQRADDAPAVPAAVVAPATSPDVLCLPALLSCLRNRDLRHLCLTTPVVHNKSPYLPASRVRLIAVPPWPENRYKRRTPPGCSSRATPVADSESTPNTAVSREAGVASTTFGQNSLPRSATGLGA